MTEYDCSVIAFEIGSRGYISTRNYSALYTLHEFVKPLAKLSKFKQNISFFSVYSSYHIFITRKKHPYLLSPFKDLSRIVFCDIKLFLTLFWGQSKVYLICEVICLDLVVIPDSLGGGGFPMQSGTTGDTWEPWEPRGVPTWSPESRWGPWVCREGSLEKSLTGLWRGVSREPSREGSIERSLEKGL